MHSISGKVVAVAGLFFPPEYLIAVCQRQGEAYQCPRKVPHETLLDKTTYLNDDDFLIRMLYKDLY